MREREHRWERERPGGHTWRASAAAAVAIELGTPGGGRAPQAPSNQPLLDLGFPPKSCTWHLDGGDGLASEFLSSLQWMAGSTWRLMASLSSSPSHAARSANCSARVTLPPRVSPSPQQAPPSGVLSSSASRTTGHRPKPGRRWRSMAAARVWRGVRERERRGSGSGWDRADPSPLSIAKPVHRR
jgi:hypothetical protein